MVLAGRMTMVEGAGNAAQVRVVAEQLFTIWEEKQGKHRASWPAWLGLAISFAVMVFSAGVLRGDVASATDRSVKNESRIEILERDRAALARIEAKVDILMEERKK